MEPFEDPARILRRILHPIGRGGHLLRHLVVQLLQLHSSRWTS